MFQDSFKDEDSLEILQVGAVESDDYIPDSKYEEVQLNELVSE